MGLTKYFHVKYSDRGSSFACFVALASASSNAVQKKKQIKEAIIHVLLLATLLTGVANPVAMILSLRFFVQIGCG